MEKEIAKNNGAKVLNRFCKLFVGIVNGEAILDLCYEEDSRAEVDMNIVMTGAGQFVELQATAERLSFNDDQLARMLCLGRTGVRDLIEIQREVITVG